MAERRPTHILSSYFAPRGHNRMYSLGMQLAQQYLSPNDKFIGIIGEAGSGKSALIRGMFPGLELTNDDNGVYIRFENGFTQMSALADAITGALEKGRRVVVEHFDLIYPLLGANANLLIGVGEQILIARPNIFGPEPEEIPGAPPDIDIPALEGAANEIIAQNLPVGYVDESHISVGDKVHKCNGPRIHVHYTGQIENFRLMHHLLYDGFKCRYLLVGCVGEKSDEILRRLDNQHQRPGWD